jgi:hypothetical protein
MDKEELKAIIDAQVTHEPYIDSYSGCPCCEPSPNAAMEKNNCGDWINVHHLRTALGLD